jgi:membrane protease YdiL (CAAX protease family)
MGIVLALTGTRTLDAGTLLGGTLASFLLILLVVGYFGCRRHGLSWREGLSLVRVERRTMLLSVGVAIALALVGVLLLALFSTGKSEMAKLAAQPGGLAVLIVLALAAPPFEEMYYRGFLYPIFERKFRPLTAGIIVTLWFTGVHVLQLAKDPIGLVPIFGMSLTATLFRVRTRSLVPAIVIHWVYNGVLVLVSLPGTQR